MVLYISRRDGRLKLGELAKVAGDLHYVSVSAAVRRFGERLAQDKVLRRALNIIREELDVSP